MKHRLHRDALALATALGALHGCALDEPGAANEPELGGTTQALGCETVSEDPASRSSDWPSAGHDWAHTGHNFGETALSRSSVARLAVAWQHQFEVTPGSPVPVIATAVAAGGTAYLVDAAGWAHARNLADGRLVWSSKVSNARPDPVFGAVVQSGPVITDDALFVGDADARLFRVERDDGEVTFWVDVDANPNALIQGDLATAGPYVVFGVSSFENEVTPGGDLTMRGSVVAVDRDFGDVAWQLYTTSDQTSQSPRFGAGVGVWSSPAIDFWRNRVYIGTGQYYEPGNDTGGCASEPDLSDSLLGISLCDGALVLNRQFTAGDVFGLNYPGGEDYPNARDFDVATPPNLFDVVRSGKSVPAVGVGDKEGTYYVMDRRTLAPLWSKRIAAGSVLGGFQGTAAFANGVLYLAAHESEDGTSLDELIPDGQAATYLGSRDGITTIQSRAQTKLFALDAATGALRWRATLPRAATFAPLVVANGVLYHGDANGHLRAFNTTNGTVLWEGQLGGFDDDEGGILGGNIITGLSLSRGRLLVSSIPLVGGAPNGLTAFGLPR